MSVSIRGVAKTKAALEAIEAAVEAASGPAVQAGGMAVARAMVSRAPRDTGELVSRIGMDVQSTGEGAVARVGSDSAHDRFVQLGTRYMSAQPYGEQAASSAEGEVAGAMEAVYRAALP